MATELVLVTGMSGAGKTTALKMLEDMGYFCVDNLPVPLIDKFVQLVREGGEGKTSGVAMGVDIRGMDKKRREEYRRRIHNGESINFSDKM